MIGARSDSHIFVKKGPLKIIAIITLWSFLFTAVGGDVLLELAINHSQHESIVGSSVSGQAWAAVGDHRLGQGTAGLSSAGSSGSGNPTLIKVPNTATFALPQYLGNVNDSWAPEQLGARAQDKRTIIHIQDAHCNYDAQRKIADIIGYLTKEYDIDTINLEGGKEGYDLSLFTDVEDNILREKVVDYFVKEGLINGAEYFAANNPEKITLWGVEDAELYLENLNAYRESLTYRDKIENHLDTLTHILTNLKWHIYPDSLLEFDRRYLKYKENNLSFKDYTRYLFQKATAMGRAIKSYKNLYILGQCLDLEENIDFKQAEAERFELITSLENILSKRELEELVVKTVAFKTEEVSQGEFYQYLVKKAKSARLDLAFYAELQKYIVYISMYSVIDQSRIMDEVSLLEDAIKEELYQNGTQRELDTLSKHLALMKNLFKVTLSREDYNYYKKHVASFQTRNYTAFIDNEAPLYKITARPDRNITDLDRYREKMARFYEYSFKRDEAFLRNIKFDQEGQHQTSSPLGTDKQLATILITGGFHSENLSNIFKEKDISYISIMPNFKNPKGYTSPYFELLSGRGNPFKEKISTILFSSLAISSFINRNIQISMPDGERGWIVSRLYGEYLKARILNSTEVKPEAKQRKDGFIIIHGIKRLGLIWDGSIIDEVDGQQLDDVDIATLEERFEVRRVTELFPALLAEEGPSEVVSERDEQPARPAKEAGEDDHAGFGVRMKGIIASNDSMTKRIQKVREWSRTRGFHWFGFRDNFDKVHITIGDRHFQITVNIRFYKRLKKRYERIAHLDTDAKRLQKFMEECVELRGEYKQQILDGLNIYLTIDVPWRSPNLYGDCIKNDYMYVNRHAPVEMDVVGVSHELMHEADVFELEPHREIEHELAQQDTLLLASEVALHQPLELLRRIKFVDRTSPLFGQAEIYKKLNDHYSSVDTVQAFFDTIPENLMNKAGIIQYINQIFALYASDREQAEQAGAMLKQALEGRLDALLGEIDRQEMPRYVPDEFIVLASVLFDKHTEKPQGLTDVEARSIEVLKNIITGKYKVEYWSYLPAAEMLMDICEYHRDTVGEDEARSILNVLEQPFGEYTRGVLLDPRGSFAYEDEARGIPIATVTFVYRGSRYEYLEKERNHYKELWERLDRITHMIGFGTVRTVLDDVNNLAPYPENMRPPNSRGQPGALLEITGDETMSLVQIPDLHGKYNNLERILHKAKIVERLTKGEENVQIVFTGDILFPLLAGADMPVQIDRVNNTLRTITRIMDLKRRFPGHVHILPGNHENALLGGTAVERGNLDERIAFAKLLHHIYRGTDEHGRAKRDVIIEQLRMFFSNAPLGIRIKSTQGNLFLVHGGIDQGFLRNVPNREAFIDIDLEKRGAPNLEGISDNPVLHRLLWFRGVSDHYAGAGEEEHIADVKNNVREFLRIMEANFMLTGHTTISRLIPVLKGIGSSGPLDEVFGVVGKQIISAAERDKAGYMDISFNQHLPEDPLELEDRNGRSAFKVVTDEDEVAEPPTISPPAAETDLGQPEDIEPGSWFRQSMYIRYAAWAETVVSFLIGGLYWFITGDLTFVPLITAGFFYLPHWLFNRPAARNITVIGLTLASFGVSRLILLHPLSGCLIAAGLTILHAAINLKVTPRRYKINIDGLASPEFAGFLEVVKQVEEIHGKGAIALYGGSVRSLSLGDGDISDIDIFIRGKSLEDPSAKKILADLQEKLQITVDPRAPLKGIEIDGLKIDVMGVYDSNTMKVTALDTFQEHIGRQQMSFNTMLMRSDGTVYDIYDGMKDLMDGTIRIIGRKAREYVDYTPILRAVRFKHQFAHMGFDYDRETRYIVENYFNKPDEFPDRKTHNAWLWLTDWHQRYKRAKENALQSGDWESVKILIEDYLVSEFTPRPLRGVSLSVGKFAGFGAGETEYLEQWESAHREGRYESAVSAFEQFMDYLGTETHPGRWPRGTSVNIDLRSPAVWDSENDPFQIGKYVRSVIEHAHNPVAAGEELIGIGAQPFLDASGIDLAEVVAQRRELDRAKTATEVFTDAELGLRRFMTPSKTIIDEAMALEGIPETQDVVPIPDIHANLQNLRNWLSDRLGYIIKGEAEDGSEDVLTERGKRARFVQMGDVIDPHHYPKRKRHFPLLNPYRIPRWLLNIVPAMFLKHAMSEKATQVSKDTLTYVKMLKAKVGSEKTQADAGLTRLCGNHELLLLMKGTDEGNMYRRLSTGWDINLYRDDVFIEELRQDVIQDRLKAAECVGGVIFVHGGLYPEVIREITEGREMSAEEVAREMNAIFKKAVIERDFSHNIFNLSYGIFSPYFNGGPYEVKVKQTYALFGYRQVVAHHDEYAVEHTLADSLGVIEGRDSLGNDVVCAVCAASKIGDTNKGNVALIFEGSRPGRIFFTKTQGKKGEVFEDIAHYARDRVLESERDSEILEGHLEILEDFIEELEDSINGRTKLRIILAAVYLLAMGEDEGTLPTARAILDAAPDNITPEILLCYASLIEDRNNFDRITAVINELDPTLTEDVSVPVVADLHRRVGEELAMRIEASQQPFESEISFLDFHEALQKGEFAVAKNIIAALGRRGELTRDQVRQLLRTVDTIARVRDGGPEEGGSFIGKFTDENGEIIEEGIDAEEIEVEERDGSISIYLDVTHKGKTLTKVYLRKKGESPNVMTTAELVERVTPLFEGVYAPAMPPVVAANFELLKAVVETLNEGRFKEIVILPDSEESRKAKGLFSRTRETLYIHAGLADNSLLLLHELGAGYVGSVGDITVHTMMRGVGKDLRAALTSDTILEVLDALPSTEPSEISAKELRDTLVDFAENKMTRPITDSEKELLLLNIENFLTNHHLKIMGNIAGLVFFYAARGIQDWLRDSNVNATEVIQGIDELPIGIAGPQDLIAAMDFGSIGDALTSPRAQEMAFSDSRKRAPSPNMQTIPRPVSQRMQTLSYEDVLAIVRDRDLHNLTPEEQEQVLSFILSAHDETLNDDRFKEIWRCIFALHPRKSNLEPAEFKAEAELLGNLVFPEVKGDVFAPETDAAEAHYRIVSPPDDGGMARVYPAKSNESNDLVAVKVSRYPLYLDKNNRNLISFMREYLIMKKLSSSVPVLKVHDAGSFTTVSDGTEYKYLWFAMEFAGGRRFLDELSQLRRSSEEVVMEIAVQLLEIVQALHDAGILHLDIKPGNLYRTNEGRFKISDVGLSEYSPEGHVDLHGFKGTPLYAPADSYNGKYSRKTDLYAVGCILFDLLKGTQFLRESTGHKHIIEQMYHSERLVERIIARLIVKPNAEAGIEAFNSARDALALLGMERGEVRLREREARLLASEPLPVEAETEDLSTLELVGSADSVRGGLIGELFHKGEMIKRGLTSREEEGRLTLREGATDLTSVRIRRDISSDNRDGYIRSVRQILESKEESDLTPLEKYMRSEILSQLDTVTRIVELEDHFVDDREADLRGSVAGFFDTPKGVLYLNHRLLESLVDDKTGDLGPQILHEIGEGFISRDGIARFFEGEGDVTGIVHTAMRGIGKDLRAAFEEELDKFGGRISTEGEFENLITNLRENKKLRDNRYYKTEHARRISGTTARLADADVESEKSRLAITDEEEGILRHNFRFIMSQDEAIRDWRRLINGFQDTLFERKNNEALTAKIAVIKQYSATVSVIGNVAADWRQDSLDYIINPRGRETRSQQHAVARSLGREFAGKYGSDTIIQGYEYSAEMAERDPEELKNSIRAQILRTITAMEKADKKKDPRGIVFVPAVLFGGMDKGEMLNELFKGIDERYQIFKDLFVVQRLGNIHEDGLIDEIMHITWGKGILNYSRIKSIRTAIELKPIEENLIRLLGSFVSNFDTIAATYADDAAAILEHIMNGDVVFEIKRIAWESIKEWKQHYDEIMQAL